MQKLPLKQRLQQLKAKIQYKMEIAHAQRHVPLKELSHVQHKSEHTKNSKNKVKHILPIRTILFCLCQSSTYHYLMFIV